MIAFEKIVEWKKLREGEVKKHGRHMPYKCPADKLTIGWGRNIEDRGISEDEAMFLLVNDIRSAESECYQLFDRFAELDDVRQFVLLDMMFNLGYSRLSRFKNMIAAIDRLDYNVATLEMMDSAWYRQTGSRARILAEMMRTGVWYDSD